MGKLSKPEKVSEIGGFGTRKSVFIDSDDGYNPNAEEAIGRWMEVKAFLDRVLPLIGDLHVELGTNEMIHINDPTRIVVEKTSEAQTRQTIYDWKLIDTGPMTWENSIVAFQQDCSADSKLPPINCDLSKEEAEETLLRTLKALRDYCLQEEQDSKVLMKLLFKVRSAVRTVIDTFVWPNPF